MKSQNPTKHSHNSQCKAIEVMNNFLYQDKNGAITCNEISKSNDQFTINRAYNKGKA